MLVCQVERIYVVRVWERGRARRWFWWGRGRGRVVWGVGALDLQREREAERCCPSRRAG